MRRLLRTLIHDWPAIALVALTLTAIGSYLGVGPARQETAGHRVIDYDAVTRLMEKGELSNREARWYHRNTARGGERRGQAADRTSSRK